MPKSLMKSFIEEDSEKEKMIKDLAKWSQESCQKLIEKEKNGIRTT